MDQEDLMEIKIKDKNYNVIINRKKNKNIYIRVDSDLNITVNVPYFTTKGEVKRLLDSNIDSVIKLVSKKEKEIEKEAGLYILGKKYEVVLINTIKKVEISGDYIYAPDNKKLDLWYKKEMESIFKDRLDYNYNLFEENIPYPKLKFRKMKTRWGVCNKRDDSVTLNTNLMKEEIEALDYVIIHELCHFVHFDHSKNFWILVNKYCHNYKEIRKKLKD